MPRPVETTLEEILAVLEQRDTVRTYGIGSSTPKRVREAWYAFLFGRSDRVLSVDNQDVPSRQNRPAKRVFFRVGEFAITIAILFFFALIMLSLQLRNNPSAVTPDESMAEPTREIVFIGQVVDDKTLKPIPGALVSLNGFQNSTTDSVGYFRLTLLKPPTGTIYGEHLPPKLLTIVARGYKTKQVPPTGEGFVTIRLTRTPSVKKLHYSNGHKIEKH